MNLHRDITDRLIEWKQSSSRKPLIIQGARQIGKTWLMKEFGRRHYTHVAYFNFDASEELSEQFDKTKDPSRLLKMLEVYTDVPIIPGETLIIFDEIQQSNNALNSLKYFCENAGDYHIMAAGSLLGVSLKHGESFPVGKVDFIKMYPLTFKEFLRADNTKAHDFIDQATDYASLPDTIINQAKESFMRYRVCGGMPKAAVEMIEGRGIETVERSQRDILTAYALDFAKHAPGVEIPRITNVWNSIPSQLARENRKFLYKLVKTGARAREYEDALLWLQQAGLIYRVFCCTKPALPLSAYDDLSAFKIYLFDTALLRVMSDLPAEIFTSANPLFSEFKGAMAENYILQSLKTQFETSPRYWVSSGTAEVDFIIQNRLEVIPVEVKSGANTSGRSLSVYISKYSPAQAVIYSHSAYSQKDNILRIPIWLADWTAKILNSL